ncbi:MAG TPA: hypothetical protein VK211_13630 [Kamptonema sp.]|nr:hypothetical protein [Kamptonema sp.]
METKSPILVQHQLNVLRGIAFSVTEIPKLRLGTTLPNASGVIAEVAGGGYLPVDLDNTKMFAADAGKTSNSAILQYPIATAAYRPISWQVTVGADIFYAGHLRNGETIEPPNYFFFDTHFTKNFTIDESNGGGLVQCTSIPLRNKRLNAVFKGQALTPQSATTIKLTKTAPHPLTGDAEPLAPVAEKEYPCALTSWRDPLLTRQTDNLLPIAFEQFTADTGQIPGYQIWSENELWYWGTLAPGKYGWNRDLLTIEPGGIIIRG